MRCSSVRCVLRRPERVHIALVTWGSVAVLVLVRAGVRGESADHDVESQSGSVWQGDQADQVCANVWYCLASLRHSRWCYRGRSLLCSVKRSICDGPIRNPVALMRATVSR
jgi:hypothetical protein